MSVSNVCASAGDIANSAWNSTKTAAESTGNFCGRIVTKVSGFWHTSVMPLVNKMVSTAKGFFGKAQTWAKSNPDQLKAIIFTAGATAIITAIFTRKCCNGDSKEAKKEEKPKEA